MPTITFNKEDDSKISEVKWTRESSSSVDGDNCFASAPSFLNFTAKRQVRNTDPKNPLPLMQFFNRSADFQNDDNDSNEWPQMEVAIDNPGGQVVRNETYTRILVDAYQLDYNGTEVWELLEGRAFEYEAVPTADNTKTVSMALHPANGEQ